MEINTFKKRVVSASPVLLSEEQLEKLYRFMERLKAVNEHINLTRITDDDAFVEKHLLDSLACPMTPEDRRVIDVGTGGGFPGIPLAIAYPEKKFVLVDATAKKVKAVKKIAADLGLANVELTAARAEALGKNPAYREQFDAVCSRAVAAYGILSELCLPLVRVGGMFYAWKGEKYREEIDAAVDGVETLGGGEIRVSQNLLLKNASFHVIIQCRKDGRTPTQYPRNYGQIKKKPL
ncbi:16S rRNA (guanine(527)-N(7))-methyltransferase RsmG [Pseudoramibacter faecis]|uniref:16S rRNA (guanine(527)-N(7))-methyltransferase RsmG n=1 Tax=Pseudoramibacter faecis TaxID=3108534 RepID=UPI002E76553A|nr:16S rRNA (guanine(527)-N(7))-methyltransferase RsmG [Pseudoramibacter sp. HA2172]